MKSTHTTLEQEVNKILRGIKAMFIDVDAVSGEEEIYNWKNGQAALLSLFEKYGSIVIGNSIDVEHWAKNKEQRLAMTTANQLRAEQTARLKQIVGKETDQFKCPSYFDNDNVLQDCFCRRCK